MPIIPQKAPKESYEKFVNWIDKKKVGRKKTKEYLFHEHLPHKVFHIDINDIHSGNDLQNAKIVSWRYYHKTSKGKHTLVEVKVGEIEGEHELLEAHYGPMAEEHKRLHEIIESMEETAKDSYELAFLRIFALKINAAWLKSENFQNDFFVPLNPCYYGFEANKIYTIKEFMEIAQIGLQRFISANVQISSDDLM